MRIVFALSILLLVGCAREHAGHTANIGEVIATVERQQIYRNLANSRINPHFLPVPYELGAGTSTLNNEIGAGISDPGFSFIGRAISGLSISGSNTFQRSFDIIPERGISERLRSRLLIQYAMWGFCSTSQRSSGRSEHQNCTFNEFKHEFDRLGSLDNSGGVVEGRSDNLGVAIANLVGRLPDSPLVEVGSACSVSRARETVDGQVFCFLGKENWSDQAVEAAFIAWFAAVTQGILLPAARTADRSQNGESSGGGRVSSERAPSALRAPGPAPLINRSFR
jgi:hypothetical protein